MQKNYREIYTFVKNYGGRKATERYLKVLIYTFKGYSLIKRNYIKSSMIASNLPDSTRVWIYQSSRPFTDNEISNLREHLQQFAQQWTSHNRQLRSHADVLHNRFLILMVDESMAGASGCSIDKSVHFMQQIGQSFKTDLFDRMTFAWKDGDSVKTASSVEFSTLYQNGEINDQTLVFDNLVKTKGELEEKWLKPLNESWHKRFV